MKTQLLIGFFLLVVAVGFFACGGDDDDDNDDGAPADDDTLDDDAIDDDTAIDDDDDDDNTAPTLYAGAAKVDVTPDFDTMLGGYGTYFLLQSWCRWSTGVHDPLYATAVALKDAVGQTVIQIAVDSVGLLKDDVQSIRDQVAAQTGLAVEQVFVSASHSHQTPDTVGLWGVIIPPISGRMPEYMELLLGGAVDAGVMAYDDLRPAFAVANSGFEPNYHFNFLWDKDDDAITDSTMTVLGLYEETTGKVIATMMNWGSHPTILPPENTLLSADFVGGYYEAMDGDLGGVNMFLQGNIGASVRSQNTYQPFEPSPDGQAWGTWEDAWRVGRGLADTAQLLLDDGVEIENPMIRIKHQTGSFLFMNPFFTLVGKLGLIPRDVPAMGEYADTIISAWRMGPFTLATAPGEVVPKLGLELRDVMTGDYKMIVNLGQDWVGYLMYPEMFNNLFVYFEYSMVCPSGQTAQGMIDAYTALFADPKF
ncbi:MAG TPA: hypothetical protein PKW95_07185 [bacterium]|nr:hypothetical protein [bacterium]